MKDPRALGPTMRAPATATAPTGTTAEPVVIMTSLTAPPESAAALEAAFKDRKRLVDAFPGFRRLRLTKGRGTHEYVLLLEWDDMASFQAYAKSEAFQHAHKTGADLVPGPLRVLDVVLDSARGE